MLNMFFKLLSLREDYRKILVKNRSESFIPYQLSHFELSVGKNGRSTFGAGSSDNQKLFQKLASYEIHYLQF